MQDPRLCYTASPPRQSFARTKFGSGESRLGKSWRWAKSCPDTVMVGKVMVAGKVMAGTISWPAMSWLGMFWPGIVLAGHSLGWQSLGWAKFWLGKV